MSAEPRQPDALQTVEEQYEKQPHRALMSNIPSVGDAEQIPGQRFAAEEVAVEVLHAAARDPEPSRMMTTK